MDFKWKNILASPYQYEGSKINVLAPPAGPKSSLQKFWLLRPGRKVPCKSFGFSGRAEKTRTNVLRPETRAGNMYKKLFFLISYHKVRIDGQRAGGDPDGIGARRRVATVGMWRDGDRCAAGLHGFEGRLVGPPRLPPGRSQDCCLST